MPKIGLGNKRSGTTAKATIALKSNPAGYRICNSFSFHHADDQGPDFACVPLASVGFGLAGHLSVADSCKPFWSQMQPLSFVGITITRFHVHVVAVAPSGRQRYAFLCFSCH